MQMNTVVVVGNPKPQSRTLDAGLRVAAHLGAIEPTVIDLAAFGAGLLGWGDENVKAAVARVSAADLVVFASPTYKASYTGLLKLFLDHFAGGEGLRGVLAIPLMLGAGPAHSMAPEVHLKPVLVELGAICPTPAIYQLDSAYTQDPSLEAWVDRWSPIVHTLLTSTVRTV